MNERTTLTRAMKHRTRAAAAVALVSALALAGCSDGGATPSGEPAGDPVTGGTLTWAIPAQPAAGGLDPMVATTIPASVIMNQAYDTLLTKSEDGQIQPHLAEAWEQPDENTYVFTLRDDVTFADGSAFTAADVIYTFDLYEDAVTSKKSYLSNVASIEATGDYEVTFTTSGPDGTLLNSLSGPLTFLIVGEEGYGNASEQERQTRTFGTGPFQLVDWQDGVSLTLEKNENYWQEGRPYIDEIVFELMPDESTRLAALQGGSVDAAYFLDGSLVDQAVQGGFTQGQTADSGPIELYVSPDGALSDLRVRQAFSLALDRQALVDTAMLGHGSIYVGVPSGNPEAPAVTADTPFYTRDVEAAKELLAEAGQPNPVVNLSYLGDVAAAHHPIYELMQQQLAEAGITLNLDSVPLAELSPVWTTGESFTDLASVPGSTKVDATAYFDAYLSEGGVLNKWEGNPDAATAMDLLVEAKTATDPAVKADLIAELSNEVAEKVLMVNTVALPVYFEVWNSDVLQGYSSDPYDARYNLIDSWIVR